MKNAAHLVRPARFVVLVAACALLAACPFDKPEDYLARGKEKAAKQDHAGAAIELKNYLQSVPRSAEGRFLLGRELLAQGDIRAAEIELQKAYDGRYDRDLVVPLLVESQVRQGEPDKILPQIVRTELKTPEANARLQAQLGKAALLKGNLDDAMKAFRATQQYEPGLAAGRLGEARVDAMRGSFDASAALVAKVMEKEPNNVDALVLKGDIALTKKDGRQEAIDAYLAAIALDPRNLQPRLTVSSLYMSGSEIDLAQKQLDQMKKLAPRHPGVSYLDALIAFTKKDYLRANDAITLSLSQFPNNSAAQILSGSISLAMNQPTQAEAHLLEGIRLAPNSIPARRVLTGIYLRQNQPQKANVILQPALAALPDDGTLLALGGEVALQQGDFANASRLFNRASQADPSNNDLRVRGAVADLAKGDDANGFAELEAAVKADTKDPRPSLALIFARLNAKQYDKAVEAWEVLNKLQPDNAANYNLRAVIAMAKNDRPAARQALERALQLRPTSGAAVRNLAQLDEADGKIDVARQRYRKLLDQDKKNPASLVALADFEARHGAKPEVVVPLLEEASRYDPSSESVITTLAAYMTAQGNLRRALSVMQAGFERNPKNLTYLSIIGDLQLQMGGVDQAIIAFRQLAAASPNDVRYQIRLAQAMVLANQADLALPIFDKAITAKPDATDVQSIAVATMLSAMKVKEASQLLSTIQKVSPKSPVLPELDGDVKAASKQYAEAAVLYRKALEQSPRSQLFIKQNVAMRNAGKVPDARAALADWLKSHPADSDVRMFEGDQALLSHDYPQATVSYRKALDANPKNVGIMNNLAWVLWLQKDPEAMALAQKAHELAPEAVDINDTLGWILVDQGETRKGLELLQKAYTAAPTPAIGLHLAKAQIKDGQKDAARTTIQALVKSAPASPEAKESRELMTTL